MGTEKKRRRWLSKRLICRQPRIVANLANSHQQEFDACCRQLQQRKSRDPPSFRQGVVNHKSLITQTRQSFRQAKGVVKRRMHRCA
jgi:hypothetical protein